MNFLALKSQISEYIITLHNYFLNNNFSEFITSRQIDHVAVKLANTQNYEEFIKEIEPLSESINYVAMNNRRIATAVLITPIDCQEFGLVRYLEIMEPKPEKIGTIEDGLDHSEIAIEDWNNLQAELKNRNINFEVKGNDFHQSIILVLENGKEIKFSNKPLKEVFQEERAAGLLKEISH